MIFKRNISSEVVIVAHGDDDNRFNATLFFLVVCHMFTKRIYLLVLIIFLSLGPFYCVCVCIGKGIVLKVVQFFYQSFPLWSDFNDVFVCGCVWVGRKGGGGIVSWNLKNFFLHCYSVHPSSGLSPLILGLLWLPNGHKKTHTKSFWWFFAKSLCTMKATSTLVHMCNEQTSTLCGLGWHHHVVDDFLFFFFSVIYLNSLRFLPGHTHTHTHLCSLLCVFSTQYICKHFGKLILHAKEGRGQSIKLTFLKRSSSINFD